MTAADPAFTEIHFTSRDGLRLYGRRYAARGGAPAGKAARPALCLAGLTRNSRDFHRLAVALSSHATGPRDVYTIDSRGRGMSEFDPNWRNYAVPLEMLDVVDFMTLSGLSDAAIVGTSRGGLIAMVMAAVHPGTTGAVVLNDIGPIIEKKGLSRIAAYVGRVPLPSKWTEAAKLVRDLNERAFPGVPADAWEEVARQWYNERMGKPAPGYDPELMRSLSVLDGVPELWPQFESLKRVPLMAIRGEKSDILSEETVAEMRRRHPAFSAHVVPGQGHAPLLWDAPTIDAIAAFLAAADATRH